MVIRISISINSTVETIPSQFRWLVECLKELESEVAPVTELEENLSNGVLLARLGNSFAPQVVPRVKIFDFDQVRSRWEPWEVID